MKYSLTLFILLSVLPYFSIVAEEKEEIKSEERSLTKDNDTSDRSTTLEELVVNGRTQRVVRFGVEYTPDKKVKKLAIDAVNLLELMALPKLNVSPGSASVTTFTGEAVSLFIDYVPANSADISGLRPEDVLRVEVLDYPDDPRFNSAQHVVNFIMIKYEWGGYTKLTGTGSPLDNPAVRGSLYSKFATKGWSFDVNSGGYGSWTNRKRGSSVETYRDIYYEGTRYNEVDRESVSGYGSKSRSNGEWTSIRAAYQSQNNYISHSIGFNRNATPFGNYINEVGFKPSIVSSNSSTSQNTSQSITPSINAYYFFNLPKNNWINISWSFSYGYTRSHNLYHLIGTAPILKDNREKVYVPNLTASYSKRFTHNNTLRVALMTYNSIYDTDYSGSYIDRQKMLSSENMLFLEYMQKWDSGLSLYSRIGSSYVIGRLNGENTLKQWNPRLGVQLSYKFNSRHSASIEGWWGNSHPSPSTTNDALIQTSELDWSMGNPDLRNTLFSLARVTYNFIPNDKFSLTASMEYEGNPHRQAIEYFTLPDHNGLVHRIINSGNSHQYEAAVGATLKLFDNSLVINGTGFAQHGVLTGLDGSSISRLAATGNVSYIRNHWSLQLYYNPPSKSMGSYSLGVRSYLPQTYGIIANCSFGDFRGMVYFSNWFRRDGFSTNIFHSPLFESRTIELSQEASRSLGITLTYTFSYGKRVNQNNELEQAPGVGSAILQ